MRWTTSPLASGFGGSDPVHAERTDDERWMEWALRLARQGWGQVAPNPMVGAVVVRDGQLVGEGLHARYGGDHAEVVALRQAGAAARGATLFVTLEPCAHTGKTPPCTEAVVAAGITRVVAAMADPNPEAAGGAQQLRAAGIEVVLGVGEQAARDLNAAFLHRWRFTRPFVTLKLAVTLESAIADGTHTTSRVTASAARQYAHWLRAGHDAVAVGMQTVRADDPQLTVRESNAPRVPPARVVFSRTGRLSLASTLANSLKQGPVIVATESIDVEYEHALHDAGVEVLQGTDLPELCRLLHARGIGSLLVEGGAQLAASFWTAGLVDRLILVRAPVIFGGNALNAFAGFPAVRAMDAQRLRVVGHEVLGDDVATTFAVRDS